MVSQSETVKYFEWIIKTLIARFFFNNAGSVLAAKYQWHFPVKRLWLFLLQLLVAVLARTHMMYFDTEEKQWKQLSSLAPGRDVLNCYCAETVGRQLFVAGIIPGGGYSTYRYDIETDKWQRHEDALSCGQISSLCTVGDYMYAVPSNYSMIPQRYSFPKRQWQSFAKFSLT